MPDKHIAQLAHHALNRAAMVIDICTGEITHRFENAMRFRITDEPGMQVRLPSAPAYGESKLEWHVEARGTWRSSRELNSREVMNGIPALMQQSLNTIKPSSGIRDFECRVWNQSKCGKADNVCQIQPFER